MNTKHNTYLDLSKLSEEQQKKVFKILNDNKQLLATQLQDIFYFGKYSEFYFYSLLFLNQWQTWQVANKIHNKTELSFPQWETMMEGTSEGNAEVDIYSGKINEERISAYKKLSAQYNISESSVRDIFNAGAEWVKNLNPQNQ